MSKTTMIILSAAGLLLLFLVCAGLGAYIYTTTLAPQALETSVAQTMSVALTQTAQSQFIAPIVLPSLTPPFTLTPELPTLSPTVTLTPTPIFTASPAIPLISVSVDTNCRVGPGKVYDRVGYLLVGQVSEIYGRNPAGNYWYIRNPNQTTAYCWLWGEYAIVSGNIAALPIFTPPPTPTPVPNFDASYYSKESCNGWWVDFKLENTGGITFNSLTLTVRDTVTDVTQTLYSDDFTDVDGCAVASTRDNLAPGVKQVVSSPAFTYDPGGHKMRATITLCSNTGQSGTCVTRVVEFTP